MISITSETENASTIDIKGKTLAFFGAFSFWPSYHPGTPEQVAKMKGAKVVAAVEEGVDFVVLGDKRSAERTEAKKVAEKLKAKAAKAATKGITLSYPETIDESEFRAIVRMDLRGKSFSFRGGFDCLGGELDEGLLKAMLDPVGATITGAIDQDLDYLVMGKRKGEGKIAANNLGKKLQKAGAKLKLLDEEGFLELVRTDRIASTDGEMDFASFITHLHGTVDQGKLGRALKMLKGESFKLYVHLTDEHVVGVVRSQTTSGVYASWLSFEGKYGCASPNLDDCMGLSGTVCKHILVLVLGLTRTNEISVETAYAWLKLARGKRSKRDLDLVAATFVDYKGAELGEIDWRPTETIPEDFYAY